MKDPKSTNDNKSMSFKARTVIRSVYTIEVDGDAIVTFSAQSLNQARELPRETWFRDDLRSKIVGGRPLWDGNMPIGVRRATLSEEARHEAMAVAETDGDLALVYLTGTEGSDAGRGASADPVPHKP